MRAVPRDAADIAGDRVVENLSRARYARGGNRLHDAGVARQEQESRGRGGELHEIVTAVRCHVRVESTAERDRVAIEWGILQPDEHAIVDREAADLVVP